MKKRILLILLIGITNLVKGQIYELGDKVGIGTTEPITKLHVVDGKIRTGGANGYYQVGYDSNDRNLGKISFHHTHQRVNSRYYAGIIYNNSSGSMTIGGGTNLNFLLDSGSSINHGNHIFRKVGWNGSTKTYREVMRINSTGNIGIGTRSPSSKIHVNSTGSSAIRVTRKGSNIFGYEIGGSTFGLYDYTNSQYKWRTGNGNVFLVESSGSVGVGTVEMGSHRLAVEGSIGAREIKVEANGWSDFVFYDNYKLPTLLEVENHIKENGHLKDIPSAKNVKRNGVNLGQMASKLLQKIEELTLYTIQQQKEIQEQKNKVEKQAKEIESLKSLTERLTKIEDQFKKNN